MKSHIFRLFATCLMIGSLSTNAVAQQVPTLDDLMWGGKNYWNLQPKSLFTAWWGDQLIVNDVEEVSLVTDANKVITDKGQKVLFTLDDINKALTAIDSTDIVRSLSGVYFSDAKQTIATIKTARNRVYYNWKTKQCEVIARPNGTQWEDYTIASKSLAYVKDWNLFVRTADGQDHQVSTDGTRQLQYGMSVHRDEWGIDHGTFWSPKGDLLAFYRMDQSMVTDFPLIDNSARVAQLAPEAYPMAGMDIHKVSVGVFNPSTGETVYLQTPEVRTDFHKDGQAVYFTNVSWSPDEKVIYLIELPRTQDKAELVAYCAKTGKRLGVLYTETHPKYVHPMHGLTFLPWDSSKFIYQSEKDGFNHLYLASLDTNSATPVIKEWKQLTSGLFVVTSLVGFNLKTRSAIIVSTESKDTRNNIYSVNIATGSRTLLDNGEGIHRPNLSQGNGTLLVDRWTSPNVYRTYDVISTSKKQTTTLRNYSESPWKDYLMPRVETGTMKAADDSTTLYWRMVKPADFDANKKYPTVVYVYGGPGLRNVEESWNYAARQWEYYMANKGYIIFVLDNRGSCQRGLEFENCTFRHLGDEEMKDQIKGVDYLKSLPYVDANRLGVHGWSFGGFMTTNLMCSYPDVFKVGVAGGPVIDWKFYEAMYGERYMDTPQENPEGFKSTSLLEKAKNLKGRLQIIVGYNDPTCVMQHSLSFLRACEDAGTQPDYFVYPGQGHNMMGSDMVHLHERITRYFDDYLK